MKIFENLKLKVGIVILVLSLGFVSCEDQLNKQPVTELTEEQAFENPESYTQFLARVYAGIAVSGQQGPAGQPDIQGIDEGFSNYLRQFWKHQELNTDEAIIAWNDGTIHDLHNHVWTPSNEFIRAMYDRIYFPAKGFGGGLPGAKGRIFLNDDTIPHPKTKYILKPDQSITLELPGGGGFYPPESRDPEMVREDVIDGLVSLEQAKEIYRIILDPDTFEIDVGETEKCRS